MPIWRSRVTESSSLMGGGPPAGGGGSLDSAGADDGPASSSLPSLTAARYFLQHSVAADAQDHTVTLPNGPATWPKHDSVSKNSVTITQHAYLHHHTSTTHKLHNSVLQYGTHDALSM